MGMDGSGTSSELCLLVSMFCVASIFSIFVRCISRVDESQLAVVGRKYIIVVLVARLVGCVCVAVEADVAGVHSFCSLFD